MNMKAIVTVVLVWTLFLILGVPFILSSVTGVPFSFLSPIVRLSTLQRVMTVKVNPTAPGTIGQTVYVTVLDAGNNTPIEGALVKVVFNGLNYYNTTTNSNGVMQFFFPGATTIVYVSKDGYQDADPIPLPQVPDSWIATRNDQYITWTLGLLGSWGPTLFLYFTQGKKKKT
jgi:hypothetical protein